MTRFPNHSAFSRARNERFRNSDILRRVFERVVEVCNAVGLVGGQGFAVDASLIVADAKQAALDPRRRLGQEPEGGEPSCEGVSGNPRFGAANTVLQLPNQLDVANERDPLPRTRGNFERLG